MTSLGLLLVLSLAPYTSHADEHSTTASDNTATCPDGKTAAPPASSTAPIVDLGVFRVSEVTQSSHSYEGTICKPHVEKSGYKVRSKWPDCGKRVRVLRQGDSLIMVDLTWPDKTYSFLLNGRLHDGGGCIGQTNDGVARARKLFGSSFCRALLDRKAATQTPDREVFQFYDSMNAKSAEICGPDAPNVFQFVLGAEQSETISLPKGTDKPSEITITQTVTGHAIFIPTSFTRSYTLTRQ